MMKIGWTFRSWLLGTSYFSPVDALYRMSFLKSTLKKIEEDNHAYRTELAGQT